MIGFAQVVECKISVDETNVLSVVVPRVILMLLERELMKSVHILPVLFSFEDWTPCQPKIP
jgi:hypothetical protein